MCWCVLRWSEWIRQQCCIDCIVEYLAAATRSFQIQNPTARLTIGCSANVTGDLQYWIEKPGPSWLWRQRAPNIKVPQFQIFRKLSHDPVQQAMPSAVTPMQLTRLSWPANTPVDTAKQRRVRTASEWTFPSTYRQKFDHS
ncbi:hypothetical protein MHYP_G00032530 [Metynnis hypsauchen]